MPKIARFMLLWSAEQDLYRLYEHGHLLLEANSASWFTWLTTHTSFSFHGRNDHFNLLKETRKKSGEGYWYAYQRQGKRIAKHYVGRSAELFTTRLEEVGRAFQKIQTLEAGTWHERKGPLTQAIEQTLQAQNAGHAAALIDRYLTGRGFDDMQDLSTLRSWLEQLPGAILSRYPLLSLHYVQVLSVSVAPEQPAASTLEQIDTLLQMADICWRAEGNLARLCKIFIFSQQKATEGPYLHLLKITRAGDALSPSHALYCHPDKVSPMFGGSTMSEFSSRRYDEDVAVLIVGGSIVGLSMALFLAQHGIPALLVERHVTTSIHPRAGGFNTRTMELFRQVDIEPVIFEQETPPGQLGEMGLRVESLTGKVLDNTEALAHRQSSIINPFASPTRTAMIGQDKLEPILQKHASELGGDIRFGTELVQFEQQVGGINALIRERATGQEYRIHAHYLVAADGNRSAIRQQLGIGSYGYGMLGRWVSILFQTDLSEALKGRKVALCFVNNATLDGVIGQAGASRDRWALFANLKPRPGERLDAPSEADCLDLVRAAIGIPDQPVTIVSMLPWELASRVAEHYQQQQVFLVGDAAHVMTTMGAFGANTGIADAHNLAWKLALVLKNKAHENLLATYGQERQSAADLAVSVSTGLYAYRLPHHEQREAIMQSAEEMLMRVRKSPDGPRPTAFSVIHGYRYRSGAVSHGNDVDALFENEPSGRSGARAPHVWLSHNGKQISTLDLYGSNFVLLAGFAGQCWHERFAKAANRMGLAVDRYTIGPDQSYSDGDGSFLTSYGISDSGAVLVRPDGFIAWRAQNAATQLVGSDEIFIELSRLLGYASPLSAL
ncbi:MAG: FAD-dependent monooxygenase [Ktedonobacteraceae bacterium]